MMLDLRSINQDRFSHAKRLWMFANLFRLFAFAAGAFAVSSAKPSPYMPQIVFVIVLVAELFQWRSDVVKGQSEALLRKLDLCRSFGVEVSEADKRDIALSVPKKNRARFSGSETPDTYFTGPGPAGPQKALENLAESAWYTKRQASFMAGLSSVLFLFFVGIALTILVITSIEVTDVNARIGISKVVTSWLLLIFSMGIIRHTWTYHQLAQGSERAYIATQHLLLRGDLSEAEAIKQWYEYQIGRASSPFLPDWRWKRKQDDLNDAWRRASEG